MMEKFDMGKFLQEAGVNLDTENRKQIEYIPIDRIVPDDNNFYELSGLEDLAENISLLGLQQPILVRLSPENQDRYIIISGHRRHAALKMLIEQDARDDLREVPCIVEHEEENPDLQQLKLIYANASTRVLSSAEQAKQAEQVEQILYRLKESGMELPGRMRDHVAQACRMSTGKLARLKVIRNGLAKEFASSYESGLIGESTAYELARIPQDVQSIIFSAREGHLNNLGACTISNIAANMTSSEKSIPKKPCPVSGACGALEKRKKAAAKLNSWEGLSCRDNTCCLDCSRLQSCSYHCDFAKSKKKELRSTAKEAEAAAAKRYEESQRPIVDAISACWQRTVNLAAEKNIDGRTLFKASRGWDSPSDDEDIVKIRDGRKTFSRGSSMPGNIGYNAINHLIAVADLLDCSIDYLLGRTDAPITAAAPFVEPEKCVNVDTWNTGNPPKPGAYIAYGLWDGEVACDMADWYDDGWNMDTVCLDSISAWTYPPDKAYLLPMSQSSTLKHASTLTPDAADADCCITGMSGSGRCGAAAYCDSDATCCLQCGEKCNTRCGWIDAQENA